MKNICSRLLLCTKALSLLMFLSLSVPGHTQVTTGTTSDGLVYNASGTAITITGYTGSGGTVVIPGAISISGTSLPVTIAWSSAFYNCTNVTSITIPSSVTNIGGAPFYYGCTSLAAITVDADNPAYSSVNGALFDKKRATLLGIPEGMTGDYTIPGSVTSIGDHALYYCTGLTGIMISRVTSIGSVAFNGCSSLASITVDPFNPAYSSVNGVLFDRSQTTLILCPEGKAGNYTIPGSATSIGSGAFYGCSALTGVTIPGNVTSIGSDAFTGCSGLTVITIPRNVTSIGSHAFSGCSSLTSAVFMGNAPSLGSGVFSSTASGFTVGYYTDAAGFTAWTYYPLSYTVTDLGYSPVVAWLLSKGFAKNADLKSEPNGDEVSLLMAYALDLDPNNNLSGSLPQPAIAANQLSLSFYAGSAGVTYLVEVSTSLNSWTTSGVTISDPDANNLCTATVPLTGARCFMRLKVIY